LANKPSYNPYSYWLVVLCLTILYYLTSVVENAWYVFKFTCDKSTIIKILNIMYTIIQCCIL
jgi:hypothetical protein